MADDLVTEAAGIITCKVLTLRDEGKTRSEIATEVQKLLDRYRLEFFGFTASDALRMLEETEKTRPRVRRKAPRHIPKKEEG
jgi:hypothetical protein